jgi:hypothetical protein
MSKNNELKISINSQYYEEYNTYYLNFLAQPNLLKQDDFEAENFIEAQAFVDRRERVSNSLMWY